jgi:hypothetical protein
LRRPSGDGIAAGMSITITPGKDGFPVIQAGPPMKRGTIVKAIKADRDAREARTAARTKRK